jgi:hypothetical protein
MTYTGVSPEAVTVFKSEYCDENSVISELLMKHFEDWVEEPILDVGAGSGEVAAAAFPNRRVVQLDRFIFPSSLPERHVRVAMDYFEFAFNTSDHFKTLLFCHVTQYLDEDPARLVQSIAALAPVKVLCVANDNDEVLGELVEWAQANLSGSNPEIAVPGFLANYIVHRSVPLTALLRCANFQELTNQTAYLLDRTLSIKEASKLESFLRSRLREPVLRINQTIKGYHLTT